MHFPVGPLLLASFLAVCESVLVCAAGAVLAHYGVLTPAARHALSKIGFYVLLPAITFVKVAEAVDASTLPELWPLLANAAVSVALGAALGYIAARAAAPPSLRRATVVVCAVGNVSIAPLLIVLSLCQTGDGLFLTSALGAECSTRGVAYVAVSGAIASLLHHIVGYHGMKPPDEEEEEEEDGKDDDSDDWMGRPAEPCGACGAPAAPPPAGGAPATTPHPPLSPASSADGGELCELDTLFQAAARVAASTPAARRRRRESGFSRAPSLAAGAGWGRAVSRPGTATWRPRRHSAPEGGCSEGAPTATPQVLTTSQSPAVRRRHPVRRLLAGAWAAVRAVESVLPLPALLSLSGLVVGCVPSLKRLLFGPRARLQFLAHTLHTISGAALPVISFVLGAALHKLPAAGVVRPRLIAAVVAVSLIALPLVGGAIVFGTGVAGLWEALDPMFVLVLVLVNAAPTAPSVQALASMFRTNEAETAALIFYEYAVYVVALPPVITGAAALIEVAPLRWRAGGFGGLAPSNDPALAGGG